MAISRLQRSKDKPRSLVVPLLAVSVASAAGLALLWILHSSATPSPAGMGPARPDRKYLYWGGRIDCPGKHCDSCAGLGHQESSLRCALEEALFLQRVFVMPSRMCLSATHNQKGILHQPSCRVFDMPSRMCLSATHDQKGILHQPSNTTSDEMWTASSCAMDSLYDLDLISRKIPVILDNSEIWSDVLTRSMQLGNRGAALVQGIRRVDLKENSQYSDVLLINRTASPLAWFMECKDRTHRSSVSLSHSFLPMMAAKRLREVADKIKNQLGDYDAIHVRRGDILKTRKDRFGVERSLHPHLDRDTRPEFIQQRIAKWIPPGRTLFIASNERTPGFFSPLSARYTLAYSSNFSDILDPVIKNNYQLFMVERLVLAGARTFVKTYNEDKNDLSLTDDPKKNTKNWQIPVYTMDGEES